MAVDNTLRYRGFNSYNLEAPNETLYSSLSDCEYLGFVTTQWVALKAGGTIASGEVRIVWIDDTGGQPRRQRDGTRLPNEVLWERHTWTVAGSSGSGQAEEYSLRAAHRVITLRAP